MQDLSITLVQAILIWEDIPANLEAFEKKILDLNKETDLIILPEMFNTGFTMNAAENAEEMQGKSMQWMASMASEKNCVICGSIIIKEQGMFFNRFIWMQPDGSYEQYDKKHLFRMGEERDHYAAGEKKLILKLKGWKIMPLICYDLRFPVWSRNSFANGSFDYDLLIYVANWPAVRSASWTTLLQARSIENMAYVAGVNRVGMDGREYVYSGDSIVASPAGHIIDKLSSEKEMISTTRLKYKDLTELREKLGVGYDWDHFSMT